MTEQRSKIYTKAVELSDMMGLSAAEEANLQSILDIFPMAIPQYYLSLIDWNDPDDPIRRMSIPSLTEIDISGDFDTSGEADNTVVTGLQHKYQQTALILSTNRCAMYCRHCFRKRLVGSSEEEIADNFDAMLDYTISGLMNTHFREASFQPEMLYEELVSYFNMMKKISYKT